MMTDDMGCLNWQQGVTLAESNPDIQQSMTEKGAASIYPRIDTEPFTDMRVRKALQLSLNIPEIAEGYYGGTATGKPVTLLSQTLKGWVDPYDEWPGDLQAEYSYNPTLAKELLAEAGYPNGFETSCLIQTNQDGALLQVVKSYFNEIGVEMEIQSEEPSVAMSIVSSGSYEAMTWNDAGMGVDRPSLAYNFFLSSSPRGDNRPFVNDPVYESMVGDVLTAPTKEAAQQASIEANEYVARQHWAITVCNQYWPQVWQPYVKGFSGERVNYNWFAGAVRARLWIDQDMKKTMGY
jgi:peptide/nickel transport system substrate-binding protein